MENKQDKDKTSILTLIQKMFRAKETNVYFVSGMCNNCSVFDNIVLPKEFRKQYIEWITPKGDETLEQYARMMAQSIDTSSPFILVGYSFGGNVIQEMNKFLSPLKNIVISSMTTEAEIPKVFEFARSIRFAERVPNKLLAATKFITTIFTKTIYQMPTEEVAKYMVYTQPVYLKWCIHQITNWKPVKNIKNVFQIHGTKDQIFLYEQMSTSVYTVKDADHLMVIDRASEVNEILTYILTSK